MIPSWVTEGAYKWAVICRLMCRRFRTESILCQTSKCNLLHCPAFNLKREFRRCKRELTRVLRFEAYQIRKIWQKIRLAMKTTITLSKKITSKGHNKFKLRTKELAGSDRALAWALKVKIILKEILVVEVVWKHQQDLEEKKSQMGILDAIILKGSKTSEVLVPSITIWILVSNFWRLLLNPKLPFSRQIVHNRLLDCQQICHKELKF